MSEKWAWILLAVVPTAVVVVIAVALTAGWICACVFGLDCCGECRP